MPKVFRKRGGTAETSREPFRPRTSRALALACVVLLHVFAARAALGAIAADPASSATGYATRTLSWAHTVGSGPDRVLVVGVSNSSNTQVRRIRYGGVALTEIVSRAGGGGNTRASLWILVAPLSGTADVVVTLSGPEDIAAGAVSFTGVEQGTPVGGSASARGTGTLASVTIASAPEEVVVDAVAARGNALSIVPGGGQAPLWTIGTGTGGNNVIGGGSTQPGAASVTMSWTLAASQSWAIGAARLRPARVVPDAAIKLASEGAGSYLSDGVYENPVATQVKAAGVMSGTAALYNVLIQNDGNVAGDVRVTGTPGGGGFTVRYLDETPMDRTADVTGPSGFLIADLPVGASRAWTIEVTPAGNPAPVAGGMAFNAFLTAASVAYPAFSDQVEAVTSSISANLTMVKSADKVTAVPGDNVTYSITVANGTDLSSASTIVVTEDVPPATGFQVGSETYSEGFSTLTPSLSYNSDSGLPWTYTPVSGGCGAPPGYDYCVTGIRWSMGGSMPTGTSFTVGFTVRVR